MGQSQFLSIVLFNHVPEFQTGQTLKGITTIIMIINQVGIYNNTERVAETNLDRLISRGKKKKKLIK